MPRVRPPIDKSDLPPAYHKLIPSDPNEAFFGYPIPGSKDPAGAQIKAKTKLNWLCQECGGTSMCSVDNARSDNKLHRFDSACPFCTAAFYLYEKFNNAFLESESVKIIAHRLDRNHPMILDERRRMEALIYSVENLKCEHTFDLTHTSIKEAVNSKFSDHLHGCPKCFAEKQARLAIEIEFEQKDKFSNCDTVIKVKELWGGKINYAGQGPSSGGLSAADNALFEVDIPGLTRDSNNLISMDSYENEIGRIRGPLVGVNTKRFLDQALSQHEMDCKTIERVKSDAYDFAAQVVFIGFKNESHIAFKYVSLLNKLSPLHIEQRCREFAFGRKGLRQGESFILAYMMLSFPKHKWEHNNRTYIKHERVLELDVGSIELSPPLFIEYQGDDSHRNDPETIERDKLKVEYFNSECHKGVLLVIDKVRSYSAEVFRMKIDEAMRLSCPENLAIKHPCTGSEVNALALDLIKQNVWTVGLRLALKLWWVNPNVQILTPLNKIISGGKFDYICGCCGKRHPNTTVKSKLDKPTKGCKECRVKVRTTDISKPTESFIKYLHSLKTDLPSNNVIIDLVEEELSSDYWVGIEQIEIL